MGEPAPCLPAVLYAARLEHNRYDSSTATPVSLKKHPSPSGVTCGGLIPRSRYVFLIGLHDAANDNGHGRYLKLLAPMGELRHHRRQDARQESREGWP